MEKKHAIFWFRRDLRLTDNAGLYHALKSEYKVRPIFIFDKNILDKLNDKKDRRVHFIYDAIAKIKADLNSLGSDLEVFFGNPENIWNKIIENKNIAEIYCNHDYEKYAIERDVKIKKLANSHGVAFYTYKDQCIFERQEIMSGSGTPYSVFTPYSRKWKETISTFYIKPYPTEKYFENFQKTSGNSIIQLIDIGFEKTDLIYSDPILDNQIIVNYHKLRDIPSIMGTTRLSVHLRFGTISIRQCVRFALKNNETWLNELIWRDFYFNILSNFHQVNQGKAFKPKYDQINWRNDEGEFRRWCDGMTGFPIVDAGMRELNATGFMHNRVRMIVASFLCKDLLIDWRWGEAYFAQKLLDFDFSANNGGWQWASGSGCDAAPYFRVFNPMEQTKKFDPELKYIKKWVPEFQSFNYPKPMVDHAKARIRALDTYKEALQ